MTSGNPGTLVYSHHPAAGPSPDPADAGSQPTVAALFRDRTAVWLLLAALLLRAGLLFSAGGTFDLKIQDERHYHEIAANILDGTGFAIDGRLTSLRPPLYPAFVAGVWLLVGDQGLTGVRVVQIIISLANCLLLYALGLRLFNRRVALIALAGRAFYPSLVFSDLLLLTEVLFTFLLTAVALLFVSFLRQPRAWRASTTGAVLGLAALTRSVLWPFPLVLVPLALAGLRGPLRTRLALAGALLVGYMIVIAPWAVRNTRLQGTVTVVDTMGGLNLWMGNYEHTPDDRMWAAVGLTGDKEWSHALHLEHPDASSWSDGRKEKWAQRAALRFMWQNPGLTLRRAVIKFSNFWGLEREFAAGVERGLYPMPAWIAWVAIAAVGVSYPLLMMLAALGVFAAAPRDRRGHLLLLTIILFICGVHTVVFGHSRYHLPLVPLLLLYAASAIDLALSRQREPIRRVTLAPALATIVLFLGIWSRELFFVDADRLRRLLDVVG